VGIRNRILVARSPEVAWELSQEHRSVRAQLTEEEKLALMGALCRAKLEQHPLVRRTLEESGDRVIVKRIVTGPPGDGFWDIGDGEGRNEAGKIWMQLREEIRG